MQVTGAVGTTAPVLPDGGHAGSTSEPPPEAGATSTAAPLLPDGGHAGTSCLPPPQQPVGLLPTGTTGFRVLPSLRNMVLTVAKPTPNLS